MSDDQIDFGEDGGGYDADDWTRLIPFTGRVATLDDVQAKKAVFALGDTEDPRVIDMDLPQPLIWWEAACSPSRLKAISDPTATRWTCWA